MIAVPAMPLREAEGDGLENLLERRWFASMNAVKKLQAECALMREAMRSAEAAWRTSRAQLARLEALHDALGDELARRDEAVRGSSLEDCGRAFSSAA